MKKDKTMNIKTTIVLLCAMLVFAACSKEKKLDENSFEISGTITGNKETQMILMEMQKCVFLPVIQRLKELIREGELGRIVMADFSSSFSSSYNSWLFDAQLFPEQTSTQALSSHFLSAEHWSSVKQATQEYE